MEVINTLISSNGNFPEDYIFSNKEIKVVPKLPDKPNIDKLYISDKLALYLIEGKIYKEGEFLISHTQQKGNLKSTKRDVESMEIKFPNQSVHVTDLALGERHIIILTDQQLVYGLGDNFYGQLGIENMMVPFTHEPLLVKNLQNIKKIYAHKYNSFAINDKKKLFVWGKSQFLGIDLACNTFKPIPMLANYKIIVFKVNSGRIIINAKVDDEIMQREDSNENSAKEESEKQKRLKQEENQSSLQQKSKKLQ